MPTDGTRNHGSSAGSCHSASSPESAAADLRASIQANKKRSEGETLGRLQQHLIREWADRHGGLISEEWFERFRLVSNHTSEHEVRFDEERSRAIKRTWSGHYGQVPFIRKAILQRRLATPLEYLERLALQNAIFADDFQIEGIIVSSKPSLILFEAIGQPSFVISQQWIVAANPDHPTPSDEEIVSYLTSVGFEPAPKSYYGWLRRADGVLIVDAKPDNFIKTQVGVTPIDLQISKGQLEEMPLPAESSVIVLPH